MNYYTKTTQQPMEAWTPDYGMEGVSVSAADMKHGSPQLGDMIATNPNNHEDKWLIAEQFFKDNYTEVVTPT